MLLVEDRAVALTFETTIKVPFLHINVCLSVGYIVLHVHLNPHSFFTNRNNNQLEECEKKTKDERHDIYLVEQELFTLPEFTPRFLVRFVLLDI